MTTVNRMDGQIIVIVKGAFDMHGCRAALRGDLAKAAQQSTTR